VLGKRCLHFKKLRQPRKKNVLKERVFTLLKVVSDVFINININM